MIRSRTARPVDRGDCPQTLMRRPVQEMQDCDTVTPRLPSPAAADAFETYPRTSRDDRIARLNRASEALVNISRDRL